MIMLHKFRANSKHNFDLSSHFWLLSQNCILWHVPGFKEHLT